MIRKIFAAVILAVLIAFAPNAYAYDFTYQAHVQDYGWMPPVGNGGVVGTTGQGKRLEALVINFSGDIRYSAHVQDIGWQSWVYSGEVAGTVGRGLSIEAIRIELGGRSAQHYDIYYRAHVQNGGWLGWAKNGEPAGTEGAGLRMEALEIRIVEKGSHFRRNRDRNERPFYRKTAHIPMT